jgi:hypothetical protein
MAPIRRSLPSSTCRRVDAGAAPSCFSTGAGGPRSTAPTTSTGWQPTSPSAAGWRGTSNTGASSSVAAISHTRGRRRGDRPPRDDRRRSGRSSHRPQCRRTPRRLGRRPRQAARWSAWCPPGVELAGVISLAGVVDLAAAARENIGNGAAVDFIGDSPEEHPERYAVADPLTQVPIPAVVRCIHARADDRVPLTQSMTYVAAAQASGEDARLLEVQGDHSSVADTPRPPGRPSFRRSGTSRPPDSPLPGMARLARPLQSQAKSRARGGRRTAPSVERQYSSERHAGLALKV